VLQLGCSSWRKPPVTAGRTRCAPARQLSVYRSAGAFDKRFPAGREGQSEPQKSAATLPENPEF